MIRGTRRRKGRGLLVQFFESPDEAASWLEGQLEWLTKRKFHVFYGVLPRIRKPESGRGSARDVDRGMWLWVDLDYKAEYKELGKIPIGEEAREAAKRRGRWFREGGDHSLEGVYREGRAWRYVKRPCLEEILEEFREKLGLEPTIVVDSGCGYQVLLKLSYDIPATQLERLERTLVGVLGADPQTKDLARVLRLPGTVNPRLGRRASVIWFSGAEYDPQDLEEKLKALVEREGKEAVIAALEELEESLRPPSFRIRLLNDSQLVEVKEILKPAYVGGHRQCVCLYLSGWAAWARIDPTQIARVIRMLYEETGDEDPLGERLSTLLYSYYKVWVKEWGGEWEKAYEHYRGEILKLGKEWGVDQIPQPSGELERKVSGRSGLQEHLEAVLGEERALEIIRKLEELFQAASPFSDSVFELMDYERRIYAVANLRRLITARVRCQDGRVIYRERVMPVAPVEVTVYEDPSGGVRRWKVRFEGLKTLEVGPDTIDKIVERLRVEALVYHRRLIDDVLSAVLNAFIRKGKAKIEYRLPETGYFLIEEDGEPRIIWNEGTLAIMTNRLPEKPDPRKVLEALAGLNHFIVNYCKEEPTQVTALALMFATPFGAVRKVLGEPQQNIALAGEPNTYKTTIAMVAPTLVGLSKNDHQTWRTGYVTYSQLANACSRHTGAFVINEAPLDYLTLKHGDIVAYLKGAPETLSGRFLESDKKPYKALATVVLTFNDLPSIGDPYLADSKRLLLVRFENVDKIRQGGRKLIEGLVNSGSLYHLAAFLRDHVNEIPLDVFRQPLPRLGRAILEFLYKKVTGRVPSWLIYKVLAEEELDPKDRLIEEVATPDLGFVSMLYQDILQAVNRLPKELRPTSNIADRYARRELVEIILKSNILGYVLYKRGKGGEEVLWILPEAKKRLRERVGLAVTLSDLARALGGRIEPRKIVKKARKVIIVDYESMVELLDSLMREELE